MPERSISATVPSGLVRDKPFAFMKGDPLEFDLSNWVSYVSAPTISRCSISAYAVLPESSIGQHTVNSAYYMDLAFWYSGTTLLLAFAPDGQFEPQEEKEVIEILSSFRNKSVLIEATNTPSNPTDTGNIKTINELWELLAGEWECEDYQYLGKTYDVVFNENEFVVADEVHYDAYI